jgi:superfamily II DNA/RNA helicase
LQYLLSVEDERKDIENTNEETPKSKIDTPLTALILCPTRELAMQVSNEYSKLVKSTVNEPYHNRIKCGSIVGGLSEQKQKRILNVRRPPLIVGTPGRLWDLVRVITFLILYFFPFGGKEGIQKKGRRRKFTTRLMLFFLD